MPVESKHTPEGLEPKRIGKPPQHFFGTEFTHDIPENFASEVNHQGKEPCGRFAAEESKPRDPNSHPFRPPEKEIPFSAQPIETHPYLSVIHLSYLRCPVLDAAANRLKVSE